MLYLRFAEINIALNFTPSGEPEFFEDPLFLSVKKSFEPYFVDRCEVDHIVSFVKVDDYEYLFNLKEKKDYVLVSKKISKKETVSFYHISMPQLQIILRNICQLVLRGKGVILHASSVVSSDKGYVFFGESGAGKSTISRKLTGGLKPFSDDSIILIKRQKGWYIYQTPVLQKNGILERTNRGVEVSKFSFIYKSKDDKLNKIINKQEAMMLIMKQLYTDKKNLNRQISFLMDLVARSEDFYKLYFSLKGFKKVSRLLQET
jgi:hypothetical protein